MNFDGFTSISFPQDEELVYVLCFKRPGSSGEIPFYIGESGRGTRRLSDYITAQFAAPTDFKVGVVIKALQEAGAKVVVKYKLTGDRKAEEANLIAQAASEHPLLNHEKGFNYKTDDRAEQSQRFKMVAAALLNGTHAIQADASDA